MDRNNTTIGIVVIIIILAVAFFAYQFISGKIKQEQQVATQMKALTDEEKIKQQQLSELDALRKRYLAQSVGQRVPSVQSQIKSLDSLRSHVQINK